MAQHAVVDRPVIFVVGATGSGKSAVAIAIARYVQSHPHHKLHPHIINADAVQMIDGLPIATNKPMAEELAVAPHHLFSILSPRENTTSITVKDYVGLASSLMEKLLEADPAALPIVCGGTNYYVQSLMQVGEIVSGDVQVGDAAMGDNAPSPDAEEEGRCAGNDHEGCSKGGGRQLWEMLNAVDPVMARRWHPNDTRRIRTSLDYYRRTGKPHSEAIASLSDHITLRYRNSIVLWVDVKDRQRLLARLDARVDGMVQRGLLNEVRAWYRDNYQRCVVAVDDNACRSSGVEKAEEEVDVRGGTAATMCTSRGLQSAIGFKEFIPALAAEMHHSEAPLTVATTTTDHDAASAECGLAQHWADALDALKSHTRRYAKQQLQWITNRLVPMCPTIRRFYRLLVDVAGECTVCESACAIIDMFLRDLVAAAGVDGGGESVVGSRTEVDRLVASGVVVDIAAATARESGGNVRVDPVSRAEGVRAASVFHCDVCDFHVCGEAQRVAHLHSKRHLGAVAHAARAAKLKEERGIDISRRKRQRKS